MDPKELKELLDQSNAELKAQFAKGSEELKNIGTLSTETKTALDNLKQQHDNLKQQIDLLRAEQLKPRPDPTPAEVKSIGQRFVEMEGLQEFAKKHSMVWSKGSFGIEFPVGDIQSAVNRELERKTTITTAAVGRATPGILNYQRVGDIYGPPQRRLRVRDLIPFSTTVMTGVDYVKENAFTSAASPVAEAGAKQESALTFVIGSAICQTISHWIPAAKQLLEDMPRLQNYIETRLMDGLADEEDYQLLRGDGVAPHIAGLIPAATAYAGTYVAASDTRIDKLNHAITELEVLNYQPDGVILNPADWRIIQVIKTNEGGANLGPYIMGGPGVPMGKTIWDLPVSLTPAMQVGKFLVGQFKGSVEGFDRQNAVVDISTEHASYFTSNLVAIRVEERVALAIGRPASMVYGSF